MLRHDEDPGERATLPVGVHETVIGLYRFIFFTNW